MQKLFMKKEDGFTLVETLFAILFLSLALTALLSTITQGSADARYVKDKTTALYLASEGLELITNYRDSYCADLGGCTSSLNGGFPNFFGATATSISSLVSCGANPKTSPGCMVGIDTRTGLFGMATCASAAVCSPLYLDTAAGGTGLFTHNSSLSTAQQTIFTRRLFADNISPGNSQGLHMIHLICVVTWTEGTINHEVTLSTDLFNRQL
jgi:type II secretory pathway pseudopilin PulG